MHNVFNCQPAREDGVNRFPNLLLTAVFSAGPAFFFPVYSAEPSGITEQAGDTDMQTDQKGEILFCPFCGAEVKGQGRFCSECGVELKKAQEWCTMKPDSCRIPDTHQHDFPSPKPVVVSPSVKQEPAPPGPPDKGLKLLVDCCAKTIATAVGDGHDEVVLYLDEATGQYQIHTYSQSPGIHTEYHRGYMSSRDAYDAVLKFAAEKKLTSLEGGRANGMAGGEYVCKYVENGELHRLSTSYVEYENHHLIYEMGSLLRGFIDREKEIKPEDKSEEKSE